MSDGPVVIAYEGSRLGQLAIEEAGGLLSAGREALILCVWQPFDLGFKPYGDEPCNAEDAVQVRAAAKRTADHGAELARRTGLIAEAVERESAPIWKGIVELADERDAAAIVLCAHCHGRLGGMLAGSVTASVTAHSKRTVIIAHPRD